MAANCADLPLACKMRCLLVEQEMSAGPKSGDVFSGDHRNGNSIG